MAAPRPIHWAMIAPAQLLLAGFIAIPALQVFWLSLTESSYGSAPVFVGLANYVFILNDPQFWTAAWNTFVVVNLVVYGELVLGTGLAFLMAGWMPLRRLLIALFLAPYAVTEVTAVVMWRFMLEPDVGLLSFWLARLGLGTIDWPFDPAHALGVIAALSIWHHLPFTFLILYAAVTGLPRDVLEAATVDGASAWQRFWRVALPLLMPAILVALLFRYITAMRLFSEVWLLTQGGPAGLTEVLAVYLYRHAFRYHEFGVAAATGWTMLLLSLLIAAPYLASMYRRMFRGA
jgi:multiple sugar transport system permease protein